MKVRLLLLMFVGFAATSLDSAWAQPASPTAELLPRYELDVDYRPALKLFEVSGTVTLRPSSTPREEVELSLSEGAGQSVFLLHDHPGDKPVVAGTLRPVAGRPGWGINTWRIRPSKPFPAGEPIRLSFRYRLNRETVANVFYMGETLAYGLGISTAWYPQVEREAVRSDGALRGLRGTGRLTFRTPDDFTVYSSGRASDRQPGRFEFEVKQPVFFSFAAGPYKITRLEGDPPAVAVQLRERGSTQEILSHSQRIVRLLGLEFYPYPHPEFAVVEVPTEVAARTGFSGAAAEGFIFSTTEFLDKRFNTALYGHEIGHQWWPYLLGPDSNEAIYLLTDGMAQYASLKAVEGLEGFPAAERYRRTGYPGYYSEYSGLNYLQLAAAGLDQPLSRTDRSRISRTLAESKGMIVWETLARELGRERFRQTLHNLFHENLLRRISFSTFREAFSRHAGVNLEWFFKQWFDREGAPDLRLEWEQVGARIEGRFLQRGLPYRVTVPVEIVGLDGSRERRELHAAGHETRFSIPTMAAASAVEIDPDFEVLRWTDEYRAQAKALIPHTIAINVHLEGQTDKAIALYRSALAKGPADDRYGLRFLLHYGLAEALFEKDDDAAAKEALRLALAQKNRPAETLPFAHLLHVKIAGREGDEETTAAAAQAVRQSAAAAGVDTGAAELLDALLRGSANAPN